MSTGGSTRDSFCHAVAGAASGVFGAAVTYPLDVVKRRLQVHGDVIKRRLRVHGVPSGHKGSIIITSLKNIMKKEGLKGLYCGLSPTLVALILSNTVYFPVYEKLKVLGHSHVDNGNQISDCATMIAAVGAGAVQAIITNPLWVVVTRFQTQGMRPEVVPYASIPSAFIRIAREEGLRGFCSGILPSLAGVSHVAIQIPAAEKIKYYIAGKDNTTVDQLGPGSVAIANAIAKLPASIVTYPHEVIRSRLQEQRYGRNSEVLYVGVIDCVKKVFQKESISGFYRGFLTNLVRTTPYAVVTFTSYDMIVKFLRQALPPDEKHSLSIPIPNPITNQNPKELKRE